MHIRPFEYQDEEHVVAMMREHPLQFPTFMKSCRLCNHKLYVESVAIIKALKQLPRTAN